jgi:hypothetical protein
MVRMVDQMKGGKLIAVILLASAIGILALSVQLVRASSTEQDGPSTVRVGVWLNSIEKVDVSAETFTVDFYLWFKYHDLKPNVEFLKGSPSKIDLITEEERPLENYLEYRVRGTFISSLDFRGFPFDEHFLAVELEDKEHGASELVFEPDEVESGIDPELDVVGWNVKGFKLYEENHAYSDENYSRFIFGVTIYHSKISVVFKNLLPIIVITLISLLTFSISVKNFGQRVSICVMALMSAVAYHLATLSTLPPLGYLTFFDRVMLVVYTLFLFNLAVSVQAMRLVEAEKVKVAENFETRMQNLLPAVVIVLSLIYIVLLGFVA